MEKDGNQKRRPRRRSGREARRRRVGLDEISLPSLPPLFVSPLRPLGLSYWGEKSKDSLHSFQLVPEVVSTSSW